MTTDYDMLNAKLDALLIGERDLLASSANFVGLLFNELQNINWLGLYLIRGDELVLGPFQGKPACVRIPVGHGVCGTAVSEMRTLRVDDVHAFDGHIACDPESRSEIVVPLQNGGEIFAVLDVDSPGTARFSSRDQTGIESLCQRFLRHLEDIEGNLSEYI